MKSTHTIWWNPPSEIQLVFVASLETVWWNPSRQDWKMRCYGLLVTIWSNATGSRGQRRWCLDGDFLNFLATNHAFRHWWKWRWFQETDLKMLTSAVGPLAIWLPGIPDCSGHASIQPDTKKGFQIVKIFFTFLNQYTSKEEWKLWLITSHLSKPANCAGGMVGSIFQWIPISIKA